MAQYEKLCRRLFLTRSSSTSALHLERVNPAGEPLAIQKTLSPDIGEELFRQVGAEPLNPGVMLGDGKWNTANLVPAISCRPRKSPRGQMASFKLKSNDFGS